MNYFDQEGHLNDLGISLYADAIKFNKVSQLPQSFKHLESCEICQHKVVDFSAIMAEVDQTEMSHHPYFDKDKNTSPDRSKGENITNKDNKKAGGGFRTLIYRLAVAAIIAALIFFGYQQFSEPSTPGIVEAPEEQVKPEEEKPNEIIQQPEETVVENKVEKQEQKQDFVAPESTSPKEEIPETTADNRELFAANYIPNDDFESMLESNFRGEDFKVNLPQKDAVFDENTDILFAWENDIPLKLTILDNEEEEQVVRTISGQNFNYSTKLLAPGIYYWKLETETDLLYLGKFTID